MLREGAQELGAPGELLLAAGAELQKLFCLLEALPRRLPKDATLSLLHCVVRHNSLPAAQTLADPPVPASAPPTATRPHLACPTSLSNGQPAR